MTREEAIEILKQFKKCLADVVFDEKGSEAWQMAIQALSQEPKTQMVDKSNFDIEQYKMDLQGAYDCGFEAGKKAEQEPCDDAISREAVIKTVHEMRVVCDTEDIDDYYELLVESFKQLPPVTHKSDKWIPVSERLPEDAYGCLVTVEIDNVSMSECVQTILNYWVGYDGETWNNSDGIPIPYEVIAWMPLPKPYEPQESEEISERNMKMWEGIFKADMRGAE